MKLFCVLSLFSSMSVFAMTEKSSKTVDISIDAIIDNACGNSGYFNPAICVTKVSKCYNRIDWPKTVQVNLKLNVVNDCLFRIIR